MTSIPHRQFRAGAALLMACVGAACASLASPSSPHDAAPQAGASPAADGAWRPSAVDDASAETIMARAHAAAGGPTWVRPRTLVMTGYGLFWRDGAAPVVNDRHVMWRVYPTQKSDAHQADGKVRIDSFRGETPVYQVAFDGVNTYDGSGRVEGAADSEQWSSSFGFGVVRHVFDAGYRLERLPDDLVDGRPAYMVKVIAPEGRTTLFGVAQDDAAILKVGFDTPRGWHERIYSNFFSKPGVDWVQPGRVRLFYDGVKSNEIIWTDFTLNEPIPDAVFVLPSP